MLQQVVQQRELLARQVHRHVSARDHAAYAVHLQVAMPHHAACRAAPATADRAATRQQLMKRKWLLQIVVSAHVQAGYPVVHRTASRQHQDRGCRQLRVQVPEHIHAVAPWQVQVQHNQVRHTLRKYRQPHPHPLLLRSCALPSPAPCAETTAMLHRLPQSTLSSALPKCLAEPRRRTKAAVQYNGKRFW